MAFKEIPVEECGINPFTDLKSYCIVTAGDVKRCNSLVVTWGMFGVMWRKPVASIFIRQSRFTKTILDSQDHFTLSFLPQELKPAMIYLGSHSGKNEDKYKNSGLTPADFSGAAGIGEARLVLVCRKLYTHEMGQAFYTDKETYTAWNSGRRANNNHSIFMGEIEHVYVKESY